MQLMQFAYNPTVERAIEAAMAREQRCQPSKPSTPPLPKTLAELLRFQGRMLSIHLQNGKDGIVLTVVPKSGQPFTVPVTGEIELLALRQRTDTQGTEIRIERGVEQNVWPVIDDFAWRMKERHGMPAHLYE